MKTHFFGMLLAAAAVFLMALGACAAECEVAHCWTVSGGSAHSTMQTNMSGCFAPLSSTAINGQNYSYIALPGTTVTASNFGTYRMACDDGASVSAKHYCGVMFDSGSITTNSSAGAALGTGNERCETGPDGCLVGSGAGIGYGDLSSISRTFTADDIGGHSYRNYFSSDPIAGTYANLNPVGGSTSFYLAGYPSLLVFAQADANTGFYEKSGSYVKEIFFTLANRFPLELRINSYAMSCGGAGITCWIDNNYRGFFIGANNGLTIIPAKVTLDKGRLPVSFSVSLDVNYSIPQFENSAACSGFATNTTRSKPSIFNFGLLDLQDFQVQMKASQDQSFCIGENGMIGQTGEFVAPRINIGFGGASDSDGLISVDECDAKSVSEAGSLVDNNNWVYCNQKEFLVELAKKILKIGSIRERTAGASQETKDALLKEQGLYSTFEASIRTQGFAKGEVLAAIASIPSAAFSNMGLNGTDYLGNYTTNPDSQKTYLANLYDKVEFGSADNFDAGLYRFAVSIDELSPPTDRYIFSASTGKVNDYLSIKVAITPISKPSFDWVFYNYGNTDITEDSIYKEPMLSGDFHLSNNLERGTTMKLTYSKNQSGADTNVLYGTFAVPIIARMADMNGKMDHNFAVQRTSGAPYLFSYWTGFASTLGSGCETIANSADTTLPYRQPDSRPQFPGTSTYLDQGEGTFFFNIDFLDQVRHNNTMYLESVVFLPRGIDEGSEGVTIYAPFDVYAKGITCRGSQGAPCVMDLNSSMTSFKVRARDPAGSPSSFASVLESIKDGSMCVHKGINDSGNAQWTIFWNQSKVLEDLAAQKSAITDATVCATREILGG